MLSVSDISRSFFGVKVLKGVSFSLEAGRVLGVIGENGAGKSTLMNVLGGVLQADSGSMTLDGMHYAPRGTREATRAGVAFIHQELNLFSNLSIAENLHVPEFPRRRIGGLKLPFIDGARMRREGERLLKEVELDLDPRMLVEELSPGQRQLVEIARALGRAARIVIFDEPTTSLTFGESERLFALIERLKARGVSIIYISHRLEEIQRLCDEVLVLRDGQVVGMGTPQTLPEGRMISLMVGREISDLYPARPAAPAREKLLEVRGLVRRGVVEATSFDLHEGEVLGVAGLMGAGRTELARTLFGLDGHDGGEVLLRGKRLRLSPGNCVEHGMAFVTENRREEGLLMDHSIAENLSLAALRQYGRGVGKWIRRSRLNARLDEMGRMVRLNAPALGRQAVRTLSGGNQQKVVLGKWLVREPSVFILDEPTRGIDVGARSEVYRLIQSLAARGAGVLLISSELEELLALCHRILVMRGGRVCHVAESPPFDREELMSAALGGMEAGAS